VEAAAGDVAATRAAPDAVVRDLFKHHFDCLAPAGGLPAGIIDRRLSLSSRCGAFRG
jgi:hypothetical protein